MVVWSEQVRLAWSRRPIEAPKKGSQKMDATTKAAVLHDMVRRMGAGGVDITTDAWLKFVEAQNDGYQTGPEIGQKVPDFTLIDQHGQNRSLKELTGPNGLLLVFSRSADW